MTRWHPGFEGKRTWATVRRHLLQAAENKIARGDALRSRLYVPEVFSVEHRDAINGRRLSQWADSISLPGKWHPLMLMIAEVKEIVPARYGYKAVIKHVPDQGFSIDEGLYRRLGRQFSEELALWAVSDDLHMIIIATFSTATAGIPFINELSLMPVNRQWLPVQNAVELQLLDHLVRGDRAFVKGLRYNLARGTPVATAVLTDCAGSPPALFVGPLADSALRALTEAGIGERLWVWNPSEPLPQGLPQPAR